MQIYILYVKISLKQLCLQFLQYWRAPTLCQHVKNYLKISIRNDQFRLQGILHDKRRDLLGIWQYNAKNLFSRKSDRDESLVKLVVDMKRRNEPGWRELTWDERQQLSSLGFYYFGKNSFVSCLNCGHVGYYKNMPNEGHVCN